MQVFAAAVFTTLLIFKHTQLSGIRYIHIAVQIVTTFQLQNFPSCRTETLSPVNTNMSPFLPLLTPFYSVSEFVYSTYLM